MHCSGFIVVNPHRLGVLVLAPGSGHLLQLELVDHQFVAAPVSDSMLYSFYFVSLQEVRQRLLALDHTTKSIDYTHLTDYLLKSTHL